MTEPDEPIPAPDPIGTDAAAPVIRVARVAIGTVVIAGEQVNLGVRTSSGRSVTVVLGLVEKARGQTVSLRDRIRSAVAEAERRGQRTVAGGRHEATSMTDGAISTAVAWAQVNVIPQLVDGLVPHLISDVVPRLIDGALPEIKARVIPALIDDLTNDPRVRDLILAQSRGVLGQATEQLRAGTARADDRVEATAHRMFGRNDKSHGGPKGLNEIRGG